MKYLSLLIMSLMPPLAAQAQVPPASLTVNLVLTNDNGGTAASGDISPTLDGNPISFGASNSAPEGNHAVAATAPSGYTVSYGGDCDSSGNITTTDGVDSICTVTVDDQPATLTVIKHVINEDLGELNADDFSIEVSGENASPSEFAGSEEGTVVTLDAGDYSVDESNYIRGSEEVVHGYSKTIGEGCSGTIGIGETRTCTITNDDPEIIVPEPEPWRPTTSTVIVVKHVINDNEGTNVASDFAIFVEDRSESRQLIRGNEEGTPVVIDAGEYDVWESNTIIETPHNYTISYSEGCEGSVEAGETVTCTITNDDPGRRETPVSSGGGGAGGLPANNPAVGPNDATSGFTPPETATPPASTTTPDAGPRVLGAEDTAESIQVCRAEDPDAGVINSSLEDVLRALDAERNPLDERVGDSLLNKILPDDTSDSDRQVIKNFLSYGTLALLHLGAGERAGVVNSYEAVYHHLPRTDCDWVDALRIAKGLMPHTLAPEREKEVEATFRAIYKRAPDLSQQNDYRTIMIMAYGLRPFVRDLAAERASIGVFRSVFRHLPRSASDWDAVRGIAYGGLPRP